MEQRQAFHEWKTDPQDTKQFFPPGYETQPSTTKLLILHKLITLVKKEGLLDNAKAAPDRGVIRIYETQKLGEKIIKVD
ncbi:hypothetical protein BofuT4_uP061040.1 [Botrytis cinerea T4]|uniref:Uncharacterized protein n=1 Tax=Botryotinia fuckeliana (strain T4) TaxID=999810 RepID=G2XTS4_BOTF4|nr:hypothetical protein BofuT4_uP061040.1 [Botrytis cinerea T4]